LSLAQDIESRVQILDIVNRYVATKKAGVNYKWLCPFHSEKSASFVISPQKNIAHCFSCGKWGGPINFLMEIEKIDFREAASILAKEAGIEMSTNFAKEKAEAGKDIYALYREATEWYHRALSHTENERALTYLLQRGITRETIDKFQLWYSGSPRDLLYALREKGFDAKFLIESGLFVSESRDKFYGRIVFPIANTMGHTVAFTGRVMDDSLPKYLNSPASHIFDKSSILYGLHLAKQPISKSGEVYIVEGQMDTIALHQAGVDNTVGISGTALTKEHIRILRRFATTIYLALDSDNAGVKATFSSIENLLNEDIEIKVIHIPNGKDPDEYTKSGGDFRSLRESALSVIDFYLREWGREYDIATLVGKKKLVEKCLEVIARLRSQVEVDFYLQEISRGLWVSMDALYTEYKKIRIKVKSEKWKVKSNETFVSNSVQPTIQLSNQPTITDLIAGYIYRYDFLDLFFREFRYTVSDLEHIAGAALLGRLTAQNLDSDDSEVLRILDLRLEEQDQSANPELIQRAFRDLLRMLHLDLLKIEKEKLLLSVDPNSTEYLRIYSDIVMKEKTFNAKN
jgi:DNA primase